MCQGCQGCQQRRRREGRSFSASAPPLSALPPADWHSSALGLTVHHALLCHPQNLRYILHCRHRRTLPRPRTASTENFVKIVRVVFEIYEQTDRPLIAILCTHPGGRSSDSAGWPTHCVETMICLWYGFVRQTKAVFVDSRVSLYHKPNGIVPV